MLEGIQVLAQIALHVPVATSAEEFFDRGDELGVEVAGEGVARVIDQDAGDHEGIVLDVVWGSCWVGEVFADSIGGFFGGVGA